MASMISGSFLKGFLRNRIAKTLGIIIILVVIFAPNGLFTGHRTVTLEAEISIVVPTAHLQGDENPTNAVLTGIITTSGNLPISGAIITAFNESGTRRTTTYSRPDGAYTLPVAYSGDLSVRVRTPYFSDAVKNVAVADGETMIVDFTTAPMTDKDSLSNALTASAHAATIQWSNSEHRDAFISQCHYCHQIGNSLTRAPRSRELWVEAVDRMEGYLVLVTDDEKASFVDRLHESFTGEPISAVQTWDVSPDLPNAIIEEWVAGDGLSFIHDADVGHDGRLYGADEGHDVLWVLDRDSGQVDEVSLPPVDLPVGGKFSGLALPIGIFTGKHGPHSMAEDGQGRLWITNSLSSRLMAYTPEENKFETYDVAADSLYLHTIRRDLKNRMWFTVAASNQVGRFDPETAQLDLLDLPTGGFSRWLADAIFPTAMWVGSFFPRDNVPITISHHKWANLGRKILSMPYGIDVNPQDGSIWYAKLYANKIGRIDPETFAIEEFDSPAVGPRRPRFAPDGTLWIPGFDGGVILSLNPETRQFKSYALPTLAPGEYETPYALNVHPNTGVVWLTSNLSDRILSFDPATEEFTSYPLPTRVSYLRDIVFTADGEICSSHSNLPAYAIEGGLAGFICLDPGD